MKFKTLIIILIFSVLLFACQEKSSADSDRPNIILIMIDDCSAVEFSCYATPDHPSGCQTPVLDGIAEDGLRFTTCWAAPLCKPARAMLLTGKYGSRTGEWGNSLGRNSRNFARDHRPVSKVLHDNGYETAVAGKWHLPGSPQQEEYGLDEYSLLAGYFGGGGLEFTWDGLWFTWSASANTFRDTAIIGRNPGKYPALYWYGAVIQNDKLLPSDSNTYAPDLCHDFAIDFITRKRENPFFLYYPIVQPHDPWLPTPDPDNPGGMTDPGFRAQLSYVEHYLQELVHALKENGLYDNTVVFFTADNATLGNGKGSCSELGVRVPLVVFGGPVKAHGVSDELVDLTDMCPTILDIAGAGSDAPEGIDGRSFKALLDGMGFTGRDYIFSFLDLERTVRTKEYMMDGAGGIWKCNTSGNLLDYKPLEENEKTRKIREELNSLAEQYPLPDENDFSADRLEQARRDYSGKQHHPTTLSAFEAGDNWMYSERRQGTGARKK